MIAKKMNPDKITHPIEGVAFWFYGNSTHELYYIMNSRRSEVLFFQLSLGDFIFEKNKNGVLSANNLIEDKDRDADRVLHKGSTLMSQNKFLPQAAYTDAQKFIEDIMDMDSVHKEIINDLIMEIHNRNWLIDAASK